MKRPSVLIEVYGGVVQRVAADEGIEVYRIDHDNLKAGDDPKEAGGPYAMERLKDIKGEVDRLRKEYERGGEQGREWINPIHHGHALNVLRRMPSDSVDCVVTSPPYR